MGDLGRVERYVCVAIFAGGLLMLSALPSAAQKAPIPRRTVRYVVDSGLHEGVGAESVVAFSQLIEVPGVPWLRLHFSAYELGRASYILITSLLDGGVQRLDAQSLPQWNSSSAFFNGDAVELELHVAPQDRAVFVKIDQITVGEWVGDVMAERLTAAAEGGVPESLCAGDDRVSSGDPRVGRIMPVGCTGWIVSNGAHLTAGHCAGADMQILEFNVPSSLPDGTPVAADPDDQYPIGTVDFFNDGAGAIGNDWAVFACNPNSNTGLLPVQAQGAFYRMSRDDSPASVRVTGYGLDSTPPGSTGGYNSDSQTQQTDTGSYLGETIEGPSDVIIEYTVDTEGGNSGSPVIILGTTTTLGIHTNAGCNPPNVGNTGTGFEHDNLENAIQTFPGGVVRYADVGHPHAASLGDGTVLRPFDTVVEAINAVPSGGIVSVVAGSYTKAAGNVFTAGQDGKSLLIEAPVGSVIIGN